MAVLAHPRAIYARSKTSRAQLSTGTVERTRLLRLLDASSPASLIVLCTPAGYGKTTLLQQWAERRAAAGDAVAWYTVEQHEKPPEVFLGYLLRALQAAGIDAATPLLPMLDEGGQKSWKPLTRLLANALHDSPQKCLLVLDDIHLIRESPALDCLQQLIDWAPPQLRIAVASRQQPGLPRAELKSKGRAIDLGLEELRMDSVETESFLGSFNPDALRADQKGLIAERCEGWVAGMKLLLLAGHRGAPNLELAPHALGEHQDVVDFFAEAILAAQPQAVQEFLLRTSVLDRLQPELCDWLPGVTDSRRWIEHCVQNGLFLTSIDSTRSWFKYHTLFAEFLRRRLRDRDPDLAKHLLQAASRWFLDSGLPFEAFDNAVRAGDLSAAAQILDGQCEKLWQRGASYALIEMVERLPQEVLEYFPRITLILAWRSVLEMKIGEARKQVAACRYAIESQARAHPLPQPELDELHQHLRHREVQIARAEYRPDVIESLCREILAHGGFANSPYLQSSVLLELQYGLREQFRFAEVAHLVEQARFAMDRSGGDYGWVFHSAIAGPSFLLAGDMTQARAVLEHGLQAATALAREGTTYAAFPAVHLAALEFEQGETDTAESLLRMYGQTGLTNLVDQMTVKLCTLARMANSRGDFAGARKILESAIELGKTHELRLLREEAGCTLLRLLGSRSSSEETLSLAKELALSLDETPDTAGRAVVTRLDSVRSLAWCRLATLHGRTPEAIAHARQWRARVANAGAHYCAVEWGILLADLLLQAADRRGASQALQRSIDFAARGQLVRLFLDAGDGILSLLASMARSTPFPDAPRQQLVERIFALQSSDSGIAETQPIKVHPTAASLQARLLDREREILQLVAQGMRNKHISEMLGITEGTVKWYMREVFAKLGVRDRVRAAALARQLQLIR